MDKNKRQAKNIKSNKVIATNNIQGTPTRLSADFSAETLQARRAWHNIFKVMKGKSLQPRVLYLARLSLRFDRKIKSFSDKQKIREFSTTKLALQQLQKELRQTTLETRKLQMGKLTGKDKHKIKVGNHPQKNTISKLAIVRRVQMQSVENAFEIKRPAT
uniref:L1 transposable element dsRBD-like domain-containing protein n=1 Tax=Sus scrofa TaxID=9823 RepID=A0A8D1HNZ5_PIG